MFFTVEGGVSESANFTCQLKTFLEACSQNVSGNKQQLVARAVSHRMPPKQKMSMNSLSSAMFL